MAIVSFKNGATEDVNAGIRTKGALRILPLYLHEKAQLKLARLGAAESLSDLRLLRGNYLEKLRGNRAGQFSIRINEQFRICFTWRNGNAFDVEIVDYH